MGDEKTGRGKKTWAGKDRTGVTQTCLAKNTIPPRRSIKRKNINLHKALGKEGEGRGENEKSQCLGLLI